MNDRASLELLKAEVGTDLAAIEAIERQLEPRAARLRAPDVRQEEIVFAAYLLHNLYTACEGLLRRIAVAFENALSPDSWHEQFLRRMALHIPAVRPAVIDAGLQRQLDALRKFRHFFRHNYAAKLDAEPIAMLADLSRQAAPALRRAVALFLQAVDEMISRSP